MAKESAGENGTGEGVNIAQAMTDAAQGAVRYDRKRIAGELRVMAREWRDVAGAYRADFSNLNLTSEGYAEASEDHAAMLDAFAAKLEGK